MPALTSSDFTANLSGSTFTWTGGQLTQTTASSSTGAFAYTNATKNSQIVIAQSDLTWQTSTPNTENYCGISIVSSAIGGYSYDQPYSATVTSRTTAGGVYRLGAGAASFNSYNVDTAIAKGKALKITYDVSTNDIKFWYWNVSAWTQMGTTQNYNILNGGSLRLNLFNDNINATNLTLITFNNIYFDSYSTDYTTQYPPGASSSGKFLMFF